MNLRNLEGTRSGDKPRNQILETPESREHKSRNQILATPEGRDSSEKDEKLDQNEGTESKDAQSKRSPLEKLKGLKNCVTENLGKKKHTETGEKSKHPFVDKLKATVEHAKEKVADTAQHIREGFGKKTHVEIDKPEPKNETTEDKKQEFDFSWGTSKRGETKNNDAPDNKKKSETDNSSDDSDSPHGHADREIGDDKPYNGQSETKNRDSREQSDGQQREIDKKKDANLKANQQIQNLHGIDAINRNNEAAKQKEAKEQEKAKQKEDDDRER